MKTCSYCGRENENEQAFCKECGTQLPALSAAPPPKKPRDLAGIKFILLAISTLFVLFVLYLLSFGPVVHWYVVQSTASPLAVATNGSLALVSSLTYTVSYPTWVDIVYHPLIDFLPPGDDDGVTGLYQRYLAWWRRSPDPTP